MKFIPQLIPDIILIKLTLKNDDRGYFAETFRQDLFEEEIGCKVNFIQENESKSTKGVLRGLHYQLPPYAQAKLVRVIEGKVLDVAVDLRKSSATFGQHVAVELTSESKDQLFIPHGFAHGFVILSDKATFAYKVDNYYAPKYERGIIYDDKDLEIDWKISSNLLKLSEKDKSSPKLCDTKDLFE